MRIDLNGEWQFKKSGDSSFKTARIPSCTFTDLLRNGEIPDPFLGENEESVKFVGETDFIYRKFFTVDDAVIQSDEVLLTCKMLDTVCDLKLNGVLIGKADNCHVKHTFDIKNGLKLGENLLEITFFSPVNFVSERYKKFGAPRNNNGQNGIVHIRKPQYHFGWDWGPVLATSGISDDIYIECSNKAKIVDTDISQIHSDGRIKLNISTDCKLFYGGCFNWDVSVICPGGGSLRQSGKLIKPLENRQTVGAGYDNSLNNEKHQTLDDKKDLTKKTINPDNDVEVILPQDDECKFEAVFEIDNPQLWWTRELSGKENQPLYEVEIKLLDTSGAILSIITKKIGLRTIELDRKPDRFGNNFRFILNGVPIFAKGANWIPADSFIDTVNAERIDRLLDAVTFSNFNMLRVWGGGYYESDLFYNKCDERGILVWQDFGFVCQAYPFFDEDFLKNVKKEIEYNVKRLRDHASLAVWCGNNEVESMSIQWFTMREYIAWTEKFFYDILPKEISNYDTATPYIEGSPCGVGHMNGYDRDNVGDTHIWAVWQGLQPISYYKRKLTRFCSEFGFESLPDIKTVMRFAKKSDLTLLSPVMRAHQKSKSGNNKMAFYIASRYRLPKKFEDYIYLSQLCQQDCISTAVEHWRRNKGRCNGALYWQLNDCWPVCSWSSVDYFGNYKALQYAAKHFFAAQSVSIEDGKDYLKIFVINDLNSKLQGKVELKILSFDGKLIYNQKTDVELDANATKCAFEFEYSSVKYNLKKCVAVASLYAWERVINEKTYLFELEKNLQFKKPHIQTDVKITGDTAEIRLQSDCYVRKLRLSHTCEDAVFSDNWFDLLPGEEKIVAQKLSSKLSTEEDYLKNLELFNLTDVAPGGNILTDFITRVKVFLTPINFFSWLYMRHIPKDIK